ncbi:MAG: gliding motility lipoprotein GldH [Bacteroidales bacterium]
MKNHKPNITSQKTILIIPVGILFFLLLWACSSDVVFEKNKSIDTDGWYFEDVVSFSNSFNDTTQLYDIFLNVRNNNEYSYRNFIVFFETEFPDGRIFRDTIETILADRAGNWTGKGFGNIKTNSFHFRRDVWFPVEGEYLFRIEQAMREEYLKGITDIGIRIERK